MRILFLPVQQTLETDPRNKFEIPQIKRILAPGKRT